MSNIKLLSIIFACILATANFLPASATVRAPVNEGVINQKVALFHNQAKDLNSKVLRLALHAYYYASKQGEVKKPFVTVIDYSKKSDEKRLWVLDLQNDTVAYHTFVAHGKGSGDRYAKHFSNEVGSHETSLGVYVTGSTYEGNHGMSLHLDGKEKGFNDNAGKRAVVMHGAWYADPSFIAHNGYAGRSWGCPAIPSNLAETIVSKIKNGSMLFAYYPNQSWLSHSKYLA
jgi:L,D-transpeptidase catalytic domain